MKKRKKFGEASDFLTPYLNYIKDKKTRKSSRRALKDAEQGKRFDFLAASDEAILAKLGWSNWNKKTLKSARRGLKQAK